MESEVSLKNNFWLCNVTLHIWWSSAACDMCTNKNKYMYKPGCKTTYSCIYLWFKNYQLRLFSYSCLSVGENADSEDHDQEENLEFVSIQREIIAVKSPSNHEWGILSDSAQGMKCLTCKYTSHNCMHVKHVLNSVENGACPDFVGDFYEYCTACASNQNAAKQSIPHCLSYQKIPFNKPGAVEGLLHGQHTVSAVGENDVCSLV